MSLLNKKILKMKKIELSADEIKVIRQQLNGEIEVWNATDEQQKHLTSVIHKAEALDEELGYEEYDDMIAWFWEKYQAQENA